MNAITITKENFRQEVMNTDKPVLLDFWASMVRTMPNNRSCYRTDCKGKR